MKTQVGKTYEGGMKIIAHEPAMGQYCYIGCVLVDGENDFYQFDETGAPAKWWHADCEWLEEIIEKPVIDWSVIPPWLNWFAVDKNNAQYFYGQPPICNIAAWKSSPPHAMAHVPESHHYNIPCDWKDSLVQRPTK